MSTRRPGAVMLLVAAAMSGVLAMPLAPTVAAAATPAATPAATAAPTSTVLSGPQKQALALDVIEGFVPHAEKFWRTSDLSVPRTGFFAATGSGVTQPRGAGDIAYAYATLLTAAPSQDSFGGVPRDTLREHAIEAIRHEAYTNVYAGGTKRWGGEDKWQSSIETYGWGWAAHLLWEDLDQDTRTVVAKVVGAEADGVVRKPMTSRVVGDTGSEDNAWNSVTPELASVLLPDDPRRASWEEGAKRLAINAQSRAADATDVRPVDGKPLNEWISTANLYPDLTLENHGFFNPIYQQGTHGDVNQAAMIAKEAGRAVPEAFSFRLPEVWDTILGPSVSDDGDLVMPQGQDWASKDYQHLNTLAAVATRLGRPDASVAESRALQIVAQRQATTGDGAILGQKDLGYESMLVMRLSNLWWTHELFGPSPVPTRDEWDAVQQKNAGVRVYPGVDVIAARLRGAQVTMSWDGTRPMGLFVPSSEDHADDPVGVAYAIGSLVGGAGGAIGPHACDCQADRFATAGSIGQRRFALIAFPDGVTMGLDRGTGRTFNVAFERIPGLTGDRPVTSAGGAGLGDLAGNWLSVGDRMGMAVVGGEGLRATETASQLQLDGSRGTGSGNRGALLLPNADAVVTKAAADTLAQPATPDAWSAAYARTPDGTGRLAVARWGGEGTAPVALTDAAGAPVTRWPAVVRASTATTAVALGNPGAAGEIIRYTVTTEGGQEVRTRLVDERTAEIRNTADVPVTVNVRDLASGDSVRRTLAPGQVVRAMSVGDRLLVGGADRFGLETAIDEVKALVERLGDIGGDGKAERLAGDLLDQLISAAGALDEATPDMADAARHVASAHRLLDRLRQTEGSAAVLAAVAEAVERIAVPLAEAERLLTVTVDVYATGDTQPGEDLTVRVAVTNRGSSASTDGSVTVGAPAGWPVGDPVAVGTLTPGQSRTVAVTLRVPTDAKAGDEVVITATLRHQVQGRPVETTGSTSVTVQPAVEVATANSELALAAGGFTATPVSLRNHTARDERVTISVAGDDGVALDRVVVAGTAANDMTVTVPASGAVDLVVGLRGTTGSGTGTVQLVATIGSGARGTALVTVHHGTDLARNGFGALFPRAYASSTQGIYAPANFNDGDPSTFWVSGSSTAATGPTKVPVDAGVEFGAPVTVSSVTIGPRVNGAATNYGPKNYTVDVTTDGTTWRTVATRIGAPNAPHTTTLPDGPVQATAVRLHITDAYDSQAVARNVQIASLEVR